jgi:hypothetical protein
MISSARPGIAPRPPANRFYCTEISPTVLQVYITCVPAIKTGHALQHAGRLTSSRQHVAEREVDPFAAWHRRTWNPVLPQLRRAAHDEQYENSDSQRA